MLKKPTDPIYMSGPSVSEKDVQLVSNVLRNGWYGDQAYHYCELFQDKFAEYHDRTFGIMTPNCTTAIHLLLSALGISEGDEVIVPECTWIGSTAAIKWLGAKTVFADIDKDSWCLSPESVLQNITPNTKAIITVNLYGNMSNMTELQRIAEENNIHLVEDAAESLGSKYKGIKSGKFGIGSVFSFHRTKTITTGEGGMLLLDDEKLYERCMFLRDHGRSSTVPYYIEEVAYKYMPSNIQAALGYAQFLRLEELVNIQRRQFSLYSTLLQDIPHISLNIEPSEVHNSYWITALVIGEQYGIDKFELMKRLHKLEVPCRPFFYPLSKLPAYNQEEEYKERNPNAYSISQRGINLPAAANLTEEQISFVSEGIKEVLSNV
tara:strand:- start:14663 stop:15796 length:1134 start_codon:yes stop_codon:yes gene_type:complete